MCRWSSCVVRARRSTNLGELWWIGGKHEWVFFDDLETSETHAEQITHCPACGRRLERKGLKTVGA